MYEFNYHKPASVKAAAEALSQSDEGKFIAGGMSLIPALKLRLATPSDLVDLSSIDELEGIRREGDRLIIGAMTTHASVADSPEVRESIPALSTLAGGIGDAQVRNRGTLGGSIAHNDPGADYPAAILGLAATVQTDRRVIDGDDFFTGLFETALEEDEIITAVSFPIPKRAGYAKFPNPASRYAIVGVMVAETNGGIRVAVTGAGSQAFRIGEMEQALARNFAAAAIAGIGVSPDQLNEDLHASSAYRANLITVMAKRAVTAAG